MVTFEIIFSNPQGVQNPDSASGTSSVLSSLFHPLLIMNEPTGEIPLALPETPLKFLLLDYP